MPRPIIDISGRTWTYGAEHELADWDTRIALPKIFSRADDWTLVNSNGIAVQPNPRTYPYGGEINTPPTTSPEGQARLLPVVINGLDTCSVNHRSNLHIHIRIPGLVKCLGLLRRIQEYVHCELPKVLDWIEPIPIGNTPAEKKRARRRKVSHHTLLTASRVAYQLSANSITDFFEREVPRSRSGQPMWHAQPRLAVNIRQLLQTDTIEFRHFPGTLDQAELLTCIEWCRDFLLSAIQQEPVELLWDRYVRRRFPRFPDFDFDREVRYQATASHNGLSKSQITENIQLILRGKFSGSESEREAQARASGLSRKHLPESASGIHNS